MYKVGKISKKNLVLILIISFTVLLAGAGFYYAYKKGYIKPRAEVIAQPLLVNGGFENGTSSWQYSKKSGTNTADFGMPKVDLAQFHFGKASLKLPTKDGKSGGTGVAPFAQEVNFMGSNATGSFTGKTVRFSIWVKWSVLQAGLNTSQKDTKKPVIGVYDYNNNRNYVTLFPGAENQWQEFYVDFPVQNNTAKSELWIYCGEKAPDKDNTCRANFDDASLHLIEGTTVGDEVTVNTDMALKRDEQRKSDLKSVQKALEAFYKDNGHYPVSGGAACADQWGVLNSAYCQIWIPDLAPKYISTLPLDPVNIFEGSTQFYYWYYSDGAGNYKIATANMESTVGKGWATMDDGCRSNQYELFTLGMSWARHGPECDTKEPKEAALKRDGQRQKDLEAVKAALAKFYQDNGRYPASAVTCADPWGVLISAYCQTWIPELVPKYISKLPLDPINSDLFYYWYYSDAGENYKIAANNMESSDGKKWANEDGGCRSNQYELFTNEMSWARHGPECDTTPKAAIYNYKAEIVSQSPKVIMSAGGQSYYKVVLKNIGDATWYKTSSTTAGAVHPRFFLETSKKGKLDLPSNVEMAEDKVKPGSTATFLFLIKVPDTVTLSEQIFGFNTLVSDVGREPTKSQNYINTPLQVTSTVYVY